MSLSAERSFAIETVAQAAEMLHNWSRGDLKPLEKAYGELVTDADLMLNTFLVDAINRSFSHDAICAEEGSSNDDPHADRRWFVDPIDGTRSFLSGEHGHSIMLALTISGRPALAVIYDSASDAVYCALRNQGISTRGWARRMPPSLLTPSPDLIWSPYGDAERGVRIKEELGLASIHFQESMGCRSIAMFHGHGVMFSSSSQRVKLWDIAAPELFVSEMGGQVSDQQGALIEYAGRDTNVYQQGAIATRGHSHQQAIDAFRKTVENNSLLENDAQSLGEDIPMKADS